MPKEQALISPRFTLSLSLSNKSNNEKKKKKLCVSLSAFSLYIHDDDYYTDFMTPTREFNLISISFRPNLHFARISISFRPHFVFSYTRFFFPLVSAAYLATLYPIHDVFFFFFFFFSSLQFVKICFKTQNNVRLNSSFNNLSFFLSFSLNYSDICLNSRFT